MTTPLNFQQMMQMLSSPVQQAGGPTGGVQAQPIINWQLRLKNALDYGGDEDLQKVVRDAAKAGISFGPQFDGMLK